MDRKEFLKGCAGGLCACAVGCIAGSSAAAETAAPADWRVSFVKQRYAKLLETLLEKVGEDKLVETLHEVGGYCAGTFGPALEKYHGDVEGFAAYIKTVGSGDLFSYDRATNTIHASSEERTDCICPLIGVAQKTPKVVCNCSIGWHQYAWEKLLGRKVRVELKESVLRGGKRCRLDIKVLDEPV